MNSLFLKMVQLKHRCQRQHYIVVRMLIPMRSLINNCHFKEEKHERRIIRAIFKIIFTHVIIFSANAILNVLIPLRGHDLGATNTVIGVVMGAYMLTAMLLRPWAGQMIARVGPIKVLRIILIINALALILYGFTGLEGYFIARLCRGYVRLSFNVLTAWYY